MIQHVTILGIPHRIQGAHGRAGNVDDPDYSEVLELLLRNIDADFVFEEACGYTTTASTIAKERLGGEKYADLNPPERNEAAQIGTTQELDWRDPRDRIWRQFHLEQKKREAKIWLEMLREHAFGRALLICGYLHLLTMANRLSAAGYEVDALTYTPWNRLCQHESKEKAVLQVPGENPNSGSCKSLTARPRKRRKARSAKGRKHKILPRR